MVIWKRYRALTRFDHLHLMLSAGDKSPPVSSKQPDRFLLIEGSLHSAVSARTGGLAPGLIREDGEVNSSRPFPIVVLASGGGTNLQAILDQLHGRGEVEVVGVGSDKAGAYALERAEAVNVPSAVFARDEFPDRESRDMAMADWIDSTGAELVALAGYMQLVSASFVERFRGRIVNVHPALLPSFPGLDAIGQALEQGVKVTGVTVHFVDEGTDTGPVISQQAVEVPANWDRDELEAAIHAVEHRIYPEAIGMIARGEVKIADDDPRKVNVARVK